MLHFLFRLSCHVLSGLKRLNLYIQFLCCLFQLFRSGLEYFICCVFRCWRCQHGQTDLHGRWSRGRIQRCTGAAHLHGRQCCLLWTGWQWTGKGGHVKTHTFAHISIINQTTIISFLPCTQRFFLLFYFTYS